MLETTTSYYPSDEDTTNWKDRRITKLRAIPGKRYHFSGQEMLDMLSDAADFHRHRGSGTVEDDLHSALDEIRSFGYSISIKRFKVVLETHFKDFYSFKFKN